MRKIFISTPMQGKEREEILEEQQRLLDIAAKELECEVELVPSFLDGEEYRNSPLLCLAVSLRRMADADLVVFGRGWKEARGCRIEHICAEEYKIPFLEEGSAMTNDATREYYESGQPKYERLPDGTTREWHENGQMAYEGLPDGTRRYWHKNGQLEYERLPDGTTREWYENGQMAYETLLNGTVILP